MFSNFERDRHHEYVDYRNKAWDTHRRLESIMRSLSRISEPTDIAIPNELNEKELIHALSQIHSIAMIDAIKKASNSNPIGKYSYTNFDKHVENSSNPIDENTYFSALYAADTAIMAAQYVLNGNNISFSLSRPPGHHAGKDYYHGFCYFNNSALAASRIKNSGSKVAILDTDAHHGDGTQQIFYNDPDVLYVSLHADPDIVLPHSGYEDEIGQGAGLGSTLNIPYKIGIGVDKYQQLLDKALAKIKMFNPRYLVHSVGFDTHREEFPHLPPLTQLSTQDYYGIGEKLRQSGYPTVTILEGGYNTEILGNAFLEYSKGLGIEELIGSRENVATRL